MNRIALTVVTIAVATTGLAGCSTAEETPAASAPPASASIVGGTAVCDEASLRTALEASYGESDTKLLRINEFECSDGWAVVFPDIGTNADDAITVTEVLEAEGQFWLVKDRMDVCGTVNMDDPTAYPADSQVPEALWQPGCNTN